MPGAEEKTLNLARKIADSLDESARQKAYAMIALFSGCECDLNEANSSIASNKVFYIKVLLALGREQEAINAAGSFSMLASDGEEKHQSEAEADIIFFLLGEGRINDARARLYRISDLYWKAMALGRLADKQAEVIQKKDDEITNLQTRAASFSEPSGAEGSKTAES
ncbi:MAG: hypothetical protein NTW46_02450 [Candidatus Nealsonbacteria bacterium]|nr:hypothetical protein [Candidatus Nealsonbacteria bacterium]